MPLPRIADQCRWASNRPVWQLRPPRMVGVVSSAEALERQASAAPRRLDRGNIDFLHAHHRIKRALCFSATGRKCFGQYARRDLPGDTPLVLTPAACALLAAIADDGVPIAIGLLLIVGCDLEGEGFIMLEHGTAVEAETRDASDCEFDGQHVTLLAGCVVAGCPEDGTHRAVRKGFGVEAGSSFGVLVVPQANRVLGHYLSFALKV